MNRITLELEQPHPLLSPNARPEHWSDKAEVVCATRFAAYGIAKDALHGQEPPRWERAYLHIDWPWRADLDNALASLKPTIDGACDAGIVANDKHIVSITIRRADDRRRVRDRRAILTFTEAAAPVSQLPVKGHSP